MSKTISTAEVEEGLSQLPMFDVHTHLTCGHLGARGLHDVLLYHMMVSDLYSAGCPDGSRLTEFPGEPSKSEAEERIGRALPYLQKARNTSTGWILRQILEGLYGWNEPITEENWRHLDKLIKERSSDPGWADEVLHGLNIERSCTEYGKRGGGIDDHRFQYSLEWAMFTRPRWGEFDAPLYELERCWGESPGPSLSPGLRPRPAVPRVIHSSTDARVAMDDYINSIPAVAVCVGTHVATDIQYREVSDAQFDDALAHRGNAGPTDQDIYASFLNELFLAGLESRRPDVGFMFSVGAEALPFETGSRLSQATIGQIGEFVARHTGLQFECLLASRHADQAFCGLARELPNLTMVGYWWHNFYPEAIRQVMAERLDMLPVNRQIGFFSDAYTIEWVYGKARMVRRQMARLFADRISTAWCSLDEALEMAREILYETPKSVMRMQPRES